MKVENVFTHDESIQYTYKGNQNNPRISFESFLANDAVRSTATTLQSTESLLLLLQGTNAYSGYVDAIAEHDILTDAERQYLLTGDITRIEKKNVTLS